MFGIFVITVEFRQRTITSGNNSHNGKKTATEINLCMGGLNNMDMKTLLFLPGVLY